MKGKIMTIEYKLTYAIDTLDKDPVKKTFKSFWELEEWLSEETQRRIEWTVAHSPYTLSEEDLEALQENENNLITIEEV
jgi:hypothetical protein